MSDAIGARVNGEPPIEAGINIVHMNADMAMDTWRKLSNRRIAAEKTIGYWLWELDTLPSYWRFAYSFYDEISGRRRASRKGHL